MNTDATNEPLPTAAPGTGGTTVIRLLLLVVLLVVGWQVFTRGSGGKAYEPSAEVGKLGGIEVTARLVEIPGEFLPNDNFYNYAFVMKYEVLDVHRGELKPGQQPAAAALHATQCAARHAASSSVLWRSDALNSISGKF